jgi:hypothetical protein
MEDLVDREDERRAEGQRAAESAVRNRNSRGAAGVAVATAAILRLAEGRVKLEPSGAAALSRADVAVPAAVNFD